MVSQIDPTKEGYEKMAITLIELRKHLYSPFYYRSNFTSADDTV